MSESADERARLKEALRHHGVAGVEDFGRFVNNTEHFAPSEFDERAAMPVLLDALPGLTDIKVVDSVAGHLGRTWARPAAFWPLHKAFLQWSHPTELRAWVIGDSLATVSTIDHIEPVLALVVDEHHGRNREMLVYGLYRFKSDPRVEPALRTLISDPDVSLHAGSARRSQQTFCRYER